MKKRMRRVICAAAIVAMTMAASGCASAWQNFKNDPVAALDTYVGYVETALGIAQGVWTTIAPLLGTNEAKADRDFAQAMATVRHAVKIAQDGVMAAVAAGITPLDLAKVFAPVADALAEVEAVVSQYLPQVGARVGGSLVSSINDLHDAVLRCKTWY